MRILFALLIIAIPATSHAFVVVETDISQPYEVFPVDNPLPAQTFYLGTLQNYPVMYEVRSEEPFTFTAQLRQPANHPPEPLSLLLIRRNDRGGGVTEIARQNNTDPSTWTKQRDSLIGISFYTAEPLQVAVEPGTYRLEVSSPDNQAQYMLTVGTEPVESSYGEQLGFVRQTQAYFGYGALNMLRSSLVYYPIGILFLLGAFYQTWRLANRYKKHA
jgi:hypothetical protein